MKTLRDFCKALETQLRDHEKEQRPLDFRNRTLPDLWDELGSQWGNRIFDARIQIKSGDVDTARKNIEHLGNYLYFVWQALDNVELTDAVKNDINEVNVLG